MSFEFHRPTKRGLTAKRLATAIAGCDISREGWAPATMERRGLPCIVFCFAVLSINKRPLPVVA